MNSKIRAPFPWFGGKGAPKIKNAIIASLPPHTGYYDGAVVLSGYDSPLYAPLETAGWDMTTVEVCCSAAGRTRHSGLRGAGSVKAKQRRTECLWRNPEAMRRIAAAGKEQNV